MTMCKLWLSCNHIQKDHVAIWYSISGEGTLFNQSYLRLLNKITVAYFVILQTQLHLNKHEFWPELKIELNFAPTIF